MLGAAVIGLSYYFYREQSREMHEAAQRVNSRTLDQHISQLRKRIERDSKQPRIIRTVHGVLPLRGRVGHCDYEAGHFSQQPRIIGRFSGSHGCMGIAPIGLAQASQKRKVGRSRMDV